MCKIEITEAEDRIIERICLIFASIYARDGEEVSPFKARLALGACHSNGCRLDLRKLRDSDDETLVHDVLGIYENTDPETGLLRNGFVPRNALSSELPSGVPGSSGEAVEQWETGGYSGCSVAPEVQKTDKTFIFLDQVPLPWLCRKEGGIWRLYRWVEGVQGFVSARKIINEEEIHVMKVASGLLPIEHARLYLKNHEGITLEASPQ